MKSARPFTSSSSLWFVVSVLFALIAAFTGHPSAQTLRVPKCSYIVSESDLDKCQQLASAGDTEAMLMLAEGYAKGFYSLGFRNSIPPNQDESLRYYIKAANLGNDKALRHLFEEYHFGRSVSKNQ